MKQNPKLDWPYATTRKKCERCRRMYRGSKNVGKGQCRECWEKAGGDTSALLRPRMTTTELRTQYESGATLRELAERHGTTIHAVYTRLKLARTKLRKRNAHMMEATC